MITDFRGEYITVTRLVGLRQEGITPRLYQISDPKGGYIILTTAEACEAIILLQAALIDWHGRLP